MSEIVHERPDQNIVDALELAFRGFDFGPMPEPFIQKINKANPDTKVISGSVRVKHAYDFETQLVVHVLDSYLLFEPEDGVETDDHRIAVWWDGDVTTTEYSIDDSVLIFNADEDTTGLEAVSAKQKLMRALKIVMSDE